MSDTIHYYQREKPHVKFSKFIKSDGGKGDFSNFTGGGSFPSGIAGWLSRSGWQVILALLVDLGQQKVAAIIMKDHIQGCVRDALARDEHSEDYVNELVTVMERYTRK